jgi:Leucine-rich repeat (LRR) protein
MQLPGTTIEYMTAMTLLHLHENRLQELPWELGEMQQLTDFSYHANELDTPTPEILSIGAIDLMNYMKTVNKSKKTKKLALTRMRLSLYPAELKTITVITDLNLSNNKLLEIDPVVARMKDLVAIDFSNNVLNTLPTALGKCGKLTFLDMSFNRISFLPDSLEGLTGLTVLKMNDNRMVRMPVFLKAMMKLQNLSLNNNEFLTVSADVKSSESFVTEPTNEQYKAIIAAAVSFSCLSLSLSHCLSVCMYACIQFICFDVRTYAHIYACMHVYKLVSVCMSVSVCIDASKYGHRQTSWS